MGNCLKVQRAATWADGDEWEEAEVCSKKAAAAAAPAVDEKKVEVKIRVTRRQLQELLEKAGCGGGRGDGGNGKAKRRQVEELLAELMNSGRVCYQQEMRRHWRPALYSIPEAVEVEESSSMADEL